MGRGIRGYKALSEVVHAMERLASPQPSALALASTGLKQWKTRFGVLKKNLRVPTRKVMAPGSWDRMISLLVSA
jgi:hypothetical protein